MNNKIYSSLSAIYVVTIIWFAHSIMFYGSDLDRLAAPSYIIVSIIILIVSGYSFAKKNHRILSALLFLVSLGLLIFTGLGICGWQFAWVILIAGAFAGLDYLIERRG